MCSIVRPEKKAAEASRPKPTTSRAALSTLNGALILGSGPSFDHGAFRAEPFDIHSRTCLAFFESRTIPPTVGGAISSTVGGVSDSELPGLESPAIPRGGRWFLLRGAGVGPPQSSPCARQRRRLVRIASRFFKLVRSNFAICHSGGESRWNHGICGSHPVGAQRPVWRVPEHGNLLPAMLSSWRHCLSMIRYGIGFSGSDWVNRGHSLKLG